MGPPGGGKGTISKKLQSEFQLHHISSGDILRQHVRDGTDLGQQIEHYITAGKLVPDQLMVDLIKAEINGAPKDGGGVLIDGFPRTVAQAEALQKFVKIDQCFHLDVPDREIIDRAAERMVHEPSGRVYDKTFKRPLQDGFDDETGEPLVRRPDDAPEAVKQRLNEYFTKTQPLVKYYGGQNVLHSLSGESQPDLLEQNRRSDAIMRELKPRLSHSDPSRAGARY